jgi:copper chaperone CopZ
MSLRTEAVDGGRTHHGQKSEVRFRGGLLQWRWPAGVESSNAIVEKGIVEVSYDEGKVCTEQLKDAIEEAGYTLAA